MNKILTMGALALASLLALPACDDENNVGESIAKGEVTIVVDSTFTVTGRSVRTLEFDSKVNQLLIGRLSAEDFGDLQASFTGRLMPAAQLSIPDSIPLEDVSGMTLRFTFAKKAFTGDTLAPQQLTVYPLTRQLPSGIDNTFDPEGYYDPQNSLGSATYTASDLGLSTYGSTVGTVNVPLKSEFAREVVNAYRTDPSVFAWPETFAKYFPGIYVKSTFGRGLVLNFSNTQFITYWTHKVKVNKLVDGKYQMVDSLMKDSTALFAISPEVLSANLLRLTPAQSIEDRIARGQQIIMSPAGYNVEVDFPAQEILNRYNRDDFNMGVINTLTYTLPVTPMNNRYNITPPPYLLMIKTSKMDDFFANSLVPKAKDTDAFWAAYDSEKGRYVFSDMRAYIVVLMEAGGQVKPEDTQFTLVPVDIATETTGSYYNQTTVVTTCTPYIAHPTVAILDIPHSKVTFTYSRQVIK